MRGVMEAGEYRAAVTKLGFSQEGIAPHLGIGKRTSQGYALAEYPIPMSVAVILRLLLAGKITIKDVEKTWKAENEK